MVQLVFVHGVSVRDDDEENPESPYKKHVAARHRAFARYCFKDTQHAFRDPLWGNFGAEPRMSERYLHLKRDQQLGGLAEVAEIEERPISDTGRDLLDVAADDFLSLVNTFSIILADENGELFDQSLAEKLADYAELLDNGEEAFSAPSWVTNGTVATDEEFLKRLALEIGVSPETLGLGGFLKRAGGKVLGAGLNLVDGPLAWGVRRMTPLIARFVGDVFVYLEDSGSQRQQIRQLIVSEIVEAARTARANNEKLILIGHSMGANILYDLLSNTDVQNEVAAMLGNPLEIDLFLSVGTQLGLLEEFSLFTSSQTGLTPPQPLSGVSHWWHVYNKMDVLSFAAKGIFPDVQQFSVDTRANIVDAHTSYFASPVFHRRLRKRLKAAGLI